jgi:SAM-dependent methyltransferase
MNCLFEPLELSAPLARALADNHCSTHPFDSVGCGWYHGSWQFFRLLGLINTISTDDDFFFRVLPQFCKTGSRILVSGAADYALLARIAAARPSAFECPQVTVMDRCLSPLLLNQWYAEQAGLPLNVVQADILRFAPRPDYDLVCTHSFLGFFDQDERERLVRAWFQMVRPGGFVATAQRVRPKEKRSCVGYSFQQVEEFTRRARSLAMMNFARVGLDPDLAEQMAHLYATRYATHAIRSVSELENLFTNAGFILREFAPGTAEGTTDRPGAPEDSTSNRWRILAQKP